MTWPFLGAVGSTMGTMGSMGAMGAMGAIGSYTPAPQAQPPQQLAPSSPLVLAPRVSAAQQRRRYRQMVFFFFVNVSIEKHAFVFSLKFN